MGKFQKLPFERKKAVQETILQVKPVMAVLFGSTAKEDYKKNSDIDLLLVYNEKKDLGKEIKEISSRYGIRVNAIIITFKEIDMREDSMKHILKTGYPVAGYNYFYEAIKNV